ncbi:MAG TPA: histidine phosphatase family protein [Rickettsiales bacterium]|nr:histidine phosphatase family protein [Rickettsiales bacterium]
MKPEATTLIIARHGNTFGPGDIVTRVGKTDLPLVESGRRQGRLMGKYLAQHRLVPDVIFTSHLQRTRQTADEAEAEMGTKLPRQALEIFNEIDYGPDENQPEDKVRARLGEEALLAWDKHAIVPQGWHVEPEKIILAWKEFAAHIAQEYQGKKVLVVTSNGIARFAVHLAEEAASQQKDTLKIATGALCVFTHAERGWQCSAWNIRPDKL